MTTPQRLSRGETAGETPAHLAKRLGIAPLHGHGSYCDAVTYSMILDFAVLAYWRKRAAQTKGEAA